MLNLLLRMNHNLSRYQEWLIHFVVVLKAISSAIVGITGGQYMTLS